MIIKEMNYSERFDRFCKALETNGAFLLVQNSKGIPNPMTIGWAMLGRVWHESILTVLVRPSRYTYELMKTAKYFSVNVPVGSMKKELEFCGTHSGRDCDKLSACGLKTTAGSIKEISLLENCDIFYECEIRHTTNVIKENLAAEIIQKYYPQGDFHAIYSGKILRAGRKSAE